MLLNFFQGQFLIGRCVIDFGKQLLNLIADMHTIHWIVGFLEGGTGVSQTLVVNEGNTSFTISSSLIKTPS